MKRIYLTFCFLLALACAHGNDDVVVGDFSLGLDPKGLPIGWHLKERAGRADFSVVETNGVHALQLRSADSSYSLQRETKVDLAQFPILSWKWKVTTLPRGGDFRHSKTDDQAAQLFVAFNHSQIIEYIWDTSAPEGLIGDAFAPPTMSIKVFVVRSSPAEAGKWLTETRDVYEDYRKLYRKSGNPPPVSGLRLQINSQHTKTSAESYFADIMFKKRG